MLLISARVWPFKSVGSPRQGEIEKGVTVLAGMNEAGNTVLLRALRKSLKAYERRHENTPHVATVLTYQLSDAEVTELNSTLQSKVALAFIFTVSHDAKNEKTISFAIDERPMLAQLVKGPHSSTDLLDMLDATQQWGRFTRRMSFLQAICFALGVLGCLGLVLMKYQ